MLQIVISCYCW